MSSRGQFFNLPSYDVLTDDMFYVTL